MINLNSPSQPLHSIVTSSVNQLVLAPESVEGVLKETENTQSTNGRRQLVDIASPLRIAQGLPALVVEANQTFKHLLNAMGSARLNGRHDTQSFFATLFGAKDMLSCIEQSYLIARALPSSLNPRLAMSMDRNHAVVTLTVEGVTYAADPRMNVPFKRVSYEQLENMLGTFSGNEPQKFSSRSLEQMGTQRRNHMHIFIRKVLESHDIQNQSLDKLIRL